MASTQSVIDIIFNGIDNASSTAEGIVKSFDDLNSAAADIAEPFADLADKLAIVQGVMIAVAGVIGTLAYQESIKFESSLLSLQKQMDENEGSAKAFSAVLEDLAIKYGTNANALVESTADFRAANFSLDTSVQLVELALKTMIAGEISAAEATEILKNSLAGFGVENDKAAESAEKIANVLNKVADISSGGFKELALGFAQLSPVAKLTGQSFEEVAATLSVVIDAGKTGSEAANGLKSAYLSLIKPVGDAKDELIKLGISFDAAGKPIGSVQDIITTMVPKWVELTQEQKLFTAATLAGKEQASVFVTVMEEQATILDRVKVATQDAGGSIDKEVVIRLKSAEQQIASANEAWRQLLRSLGDQFQVNTTGAISSLGQLAISLKTVTEGGGLDPLFDLLRPQLAEFENLLRTVAANLPAAFKDVDFSGIVKAFESLGVESRKAIEALFGPIDLNSIEGLKIAIQNVLDVITGIVNLTAGELGGLAPFLSGMRQMVTAFKDATPEAQGYLGTLLGFSSGFSQFSGVLEGVNTALLGVLAFGGKIGGLVQGFGAFAAAMAGPQGLAVALGAATAALVTWLVPAEDLADYAWPDWLAGYEGATPGTAAADIAEGFESLANRLSKALPYLDQTGTTIARLDANLKNLAEPGPYERFGNSVQDAAQKAADGVEALAEGWVKQDEAAKKAAGDTTKSLDAANKSTIAWGDSIKGLPPIKPPEGVEKIEGVFKSAGAAAGSYATSVEGVSTAYSQIGSGTVKATGAFAAVADKTKDAKDQLDALTQGGKLTVDQLTEITKTANDFEVKMEEIASNERIKTIEFAVSLKTAQLETDMERVKATFASIDNTITNTGDLLGSLFSDFASTNDRYKELAIQDQIDLENKRRQEALDIQKRLAEAEIERIEAQTRQLNRGDPWIKIDGTRLQPQLEAFMWEILKAIRTQVNAEFANFLLGTA